MTTPHKATPGDWRQVETHARANSPTGSVILELRDRIEALEAAANRQAILDGSPAPTAGLVERVKAAIAFEREEISPEYGYEARAAIRVVAEHIRQIGCLNSNAIAQWLEMEAAE